MEKQTKKAMFVGGPLDGQTRSINADKTEYRHEAAPTSDDIKAGEIPVAFFPPMHEYIYKEEPAGSGTFILSTQIHQ